MKRMQPLMRMGMLSLLTASCLADNKIPSVLLYQNQPINALCFSMSEPDNQLINLQTCHQQNVEMSVTDQQKDLIAEGYIGFNWRAKHPDFEEQGYSYYKIFPAAHNKYWLYSISNTGGTGQFSNLSIVERKNDHTLSVQHLVGGDRCNGGIADVKETNKELHFSVNLTPYDVFQLANPVKRLEAYNDLSSCAICCVAKAFYVFDATLKPKLQQIEFNQVPSQEEMSTQGKYQACFNKLEETYLKKGQTKLTEQQLKAFITQFSRDCL